MAECLQLCPEVTATSNQCPVCEQPLTKFGGEDGVCLVCLWGGGLQNPEGEHGETIANWSIPGHDLLGEISRGGMGVIFRAMQHQPRRIVALKMLLPGKSNAKGLQERFRVEAAAMAQMNHPGILPLYQFGDVDGVPYFTMKLATGGALSQRIKAGQKVTARQVASWVASLAATLHYAHQHGILHRDIKPANILFDEADSPCLGDFGLAKLAGDESELTRTTHVMGTPCYLPPEVAMHGSKAATTASDVYSLGAVLYELLAGRPPFIVEGMAALIRKIADEMPESPSTFAQSIPRDLEIICMTCLAKEPTRRYGSAGELAADLNCWMEGKPILARRFSNMEKLASWARRKPALAGLSATLVASLLGGGLALWWKNGQLNAALGIAEQNRRVADRRTEFLLGNFADTLEDLGRVDLLDLAWENLDATQRDNAAWANTPASRQLLVRWSHALLLQGRFQEAETKARQALTLLHGLNSPDDMLVTRKASVALVEALADGGRYEQAMAEIEALRMMVPTGYPGGQDRVNAETDLLAAETVFRQERMGDRMLQALEIAKSALEAARRWSSREPQSADATFLVVRCLRAKARALYYAREPGNSIPLFLEARDAAGALSARSHPSADWKEAWADLIGWVGTAQSRLGPEKQDAAAAAMKTELSATADLLQGNPRNVRLRLRLAECHAAMDRFYKERNQMEAARPYSRERVRMMSGLYQDAPHWRDVKIGLLDANFCEAEALIKNQDEAAAGAMITEALSVAASVLAARPRDIRDQKGWQEATVRAAELWQRAGHTDQAMRLLVDASEYCSSHALEKVAEAPWWQWSQAFFLRRQAEGCRKEGRMDDMLAKTRAALQLRVSLLAAKWELEVSSNEVPSTYLKIGQALTEDGRIAEALASAREALKCWKEHGQETTPLHDWLSTFQTTVAAASDGRQEWAEEGKSFAIEVVETMKGRVAEKNFAGPEKQNWEKLCQLAGNPPQFPKASQLLKRTGIDQFVNSIGKNLPPDREMFGRVAEMLRGPRSGTVGEPGQQCRVVLQRPCLPGEILRPITVESAHAMGDKVLEMVSAAPRDQRHHPAQHGLHDCPAPAFLESRAEIIDKYVQGIEKCRDRLPGGWHQIPALIIEMVRPARGHLIAPAKHPEPHRLAQAKALVAERKVVGKFVGIRSGDSADGEGIARLFDSTGSERELGRVDVISRHDPIDAQSLWTLEAAMPCPGIVERHIRRSSGPARFAAQCPAIPGFQQAALGGGDIEDAMDHSKPHGLEFAIEMPHHFAAPDHAQSATKAVAQHAILDEEPIAQGDGPAVQLDRQLMLQGGLHSQSGEIVQPHGIGVVSRVVGDHSDVVFAGEQPQRMHKLGIRSSNVGWPVEPVNVRLFILHHAHSLSANCAIMQS